MLSYNDIVLITGPPDSAYINLFGKIKEKKLEKVDGKVKNIFHVFIDIQGVTEKYDLIYLEKLVDQKLGNTMFMLQSFTSDHLKNALQFCTFTDLFNIYRLKNSYINDAFNGTEGIKIDFRNDNSDDKLKIFPTYKQLYSTQNRISIVFDELINLEWIDIYEPLGTSLQGLINLKYITFGYGYNEQLGTSLQGLINLKYIKFEGNKDFDGFNKPLGKSLKGLINLKYINFGYSFRQHLGKSLKGLINLEELFFSYHYDKPLGKSLRGLTNLEVLSLGDFDVFSIDELNKSLRGLTKLQIISYGLDSYQVLYYMYHKNHANFFELKKMNNYYYWNKYW
jgi:hypothetical protein